MHHDSLLLHLPILTPNLEEKKGSKCKQNSANNSKKIPYLWAGLSNMPNDTEYKYWQPTYPFSDKEADAYYKDLQYMESAALSGVPMHSMANEQHKIKDKQFLEQEARDHFMKTGQTQDQSALLLHYQKAAQKFLLTVSFLEGHLKEIIRLTDEYGDTAQDVISALGIEEDKDLLSIEQIQNTLSSSMSLPPWRLVLENVAVFLPNESFILVNSIEMSEYLQDHPNLCNLSKELVQKFSLPDNTKEIYTNVENIICYGHKVSYSNKSPIQNQWLQKKVHCIIMENN